MSQRDEQVREIRELSDVEAVRALTVLVEDRGLLSSAMKIALADEELGDALKTAGVDSGGGEGEGDVARAALEYVALSGDSVVGEAVEYVRSPMERFDPVSVSVGVLAITLLQTEVVVKRDARGRWSVTVHKRALKDAALARVLTALLSHLTDGK
ncbi:hypothetical protein SSOG_07242 [Streptomyces himastatinicus ATCC 53653]|uniref:Uncharacterized protein n=1 Tax=Streptomyces himastatinicus ATCC 53653 TaxID=457427 RepID=D9WH48_9ACTN|nr:hypothetical protein [Streptomyces himastatinicus]EFL27528.1 hypothetical protein SSOG_07242 [Streptomyces himastatinicus ATCC 53653]